MLWHFYEWLTANAEQWHFEPHRIARAVALLTGASERAREIVDLDRRTFTVRVCGPINQVLLRNLLLWQNHVLRSYPELNDGRPIDVVFLIAGSADNPRYFDLFSAALMLERVRDVCLVDREEVIDGAAPVLFTLKEKVRWHETRPFSDLGLLPSDAGGHETLAGLKLLPGGRKRANDFFKLAMPEKRIIAVGLRENSDGAVDQTDLDHWLTLFGQASLNHSDISFVILNRCSPSQRRDWPARVRFARHAGLSFQDTVSLAMLADGYVGVLDLLGLAALSAAMPGVYVPLTPEAIVCGGGLAQTDQQIIPHSCDPAELRRAFDTFVARYSGPSN
jgi:hypothetical protein